MSGFGIRKAAPPRSAHSYYRKRCERRDRRHGYGGWPIRVEQIADRDHLFECFQKLRRDGGAAPGVDGFTYDDFSPSEVGNMLGVLSRILQDGTYRPQDVRMVLIPKPGTDAYRRLKIGTLLDRVVGKAVDDAFKGLWEARFLPRSYGFRPGRNAWRMLADLEVEVMETGNRFLAIEDLKNAFDNVPVDEVLECHDRALHAIHQKDFTAVDKSRTLELVATVLRGHDTQRQRGIDQGAPYSPCALNLLLHDTHDVPLSNKLPSSLLWFRYADNLAYLVRSMSEGEQVLAEVAGLLQPLGLNLKGKEEDGVRNLYDEKIQLLGFSLTWAGECFDISPGKDSLKLLEQHLGQAHVAPHSPETVRKMVLGWVEALGPAFENGDAAEVLDMASRHGLRELPSRKIVATQWKGSWERWQACRKRAWRRYRETS